ncbi:MAG: hypothetical protein A2126_04690 [Candidatus Woykebacteria bacterium GWB1_45_5]|uniref:Uncharacterized protein n=2 Tax=Candidatus Woykeibacteriota TaxID=1817899 RepID=A0A1G1W483_9BACT|nr:MAG: hypothetical protein A2113_01725 [Candidatus Woykebacteria bacterium GWA1_44_8]OGY22573.1 MAG: hypothetical protein A2126_04690 [Candidatus Woykebacteria bacterium GWB1_45_5]
MEIAAFKQFGKKFGKNWICRCGASFQAEWLEATVSDKSGATARYLCQACGREQTVSLIETSRKTNSTLAIEIPSSQLTSDDVLEIKKEAAGISFIQIRNLGRKGRPTKAPALKITRGQAV